jgi:hypothetical protein
VICAQASTQISRIEGIRRIAVERPLSRQIEAFVQGGVWRRGINTASPCRGTVASLIARPRIVGLHQLDASVCKRRIL